MRGIFMSVITMEGLHCAAFSALQNRPSGFGAITPGRNQFREPVRSFSSSSTINIFRGSFLASCLPVSAAIHRLHTATTNIRGYFPWSKVANQQPAAHPIQIRPTLC